MESKLVLSQPDIRFNPTQWLPPMKTFIKTAMQNVAYNLEAKKKFHKQAEKVLRKLAKLLGYQKNDYDLRHNEGGIAVSGEITLHSNNLYVQLSQSVVSSGFMWRTCKGKTDYTGNRNYWTTWDQLENLEKLAATMTDSIKREQTT